MGVARWAVTKLRGDFKVHCTAWGRRASEHLSENLANFEAGLPKGQLPHRSHVKSDCTHFCQPSPVTYGWVRELLPALAVALAAADEPTEEPAGAPVAAEAAEGAPVAAEEPVLETAQEPAEAAVAADAAR